MSPLNGLAREFVFVYSIMMKFTVSTGICNVSSISYIFCQSIYSKALKKTTGICFAFELLMIRICLMLRICPDIDLFWQNPFWLLRNTGTIWVLWLLSGKKSKIFMVTDVKVITQLVVLPRAPFLVMIVSILFSICL